MKPKRQSVIQYVLVLAVLATLCSWPAVSGSLKGSAEKLIDQRLQTDNMFKTAGSTPPTLTASKTQSLTDCGSKWYQRLGLQFLEVEQAIGGGYSFNTACQAHDACYGDCRTVRSECDKKLLADAEGVCESAQNKANCIADAQIFFQAVSEKGDTPFKQARANCPDKGGKDDIRSIDFRNFTYETGKGSCADMLGKTAVQVRNGESESTNDNLSFVIYDFRIFYGDLTGDERDEAVVLTYCGGMHPIEQAFIYTIQNGRAVLLTKLEEGERASGGIVFGYLCQGCSDIKIQNGLLTVERMWGGPMCCPEYIEKKTYRWNGRQLIQVGKAQRRKFIER
jgi:hypothetical protein